MCLAHTNRLSSGSADHTIKLWDISTQQCTATYTHHTDKVQSIQWNPAEPSVLLTGKIEMLMWFLYGMILVVMDVEWRC